MLIKKLEKAMHEEVKAMFVNNICTKVRHSFVRDYYTLQEKASVDVNRKQIMMIWSFKRKYHSERLLDRYKVQLYAHSRQQQGRRSIIRNIYTCHVLDVSLYPSSIVQDT